MSKQPKADLRTDSQSAYERFCEANPDVKISKQKWAAVVRGFNESIIDYILETGEKVRLPWGVGALSVSKFKPRRTKIFEGKEYINLAVDWAATKRLGKRTYHLNAHTDGNRFKWYWFRKDCMIDFSPVRFFKPCKSASHKLAAYLKGNPEKYGQMYKPMSKKFNNLSDKRESKGR